MIGGDGDLHLSGESLSAVTSTLAASRARRRKLLERGFGVIGEGIWVRERERDARERETL